MLKPTDYTYEVGPVTTIIPIGASQPTEGVDLGGFHLAGIFMPPAWTAASLTLQTSFSNDPNWYNVYDSTGAEYTITVDANRWVTLDLARTIALGNWIRIRSGTSAAPVNQAAARSVLLIPRSF